MKDNNLIPFTCIASNNMKSLEKDVSAYPYKHGQGCYKGQTEPMLIIFGISEKEAIMLGKKHDQESVLYVYNDRTASLLYMNDTSVSIGVWKRVNEHVALSKDAYTYCENKFYVAE